jgi:hypothetical protein
MVGTIRVYATNGAVGVCSQAWEIVRRILSPTFAPSAVQTLPLARTPMVDDCFAEKSHWEINYRGRYRAVQPGRVPLAPARANRGPCDLIRSIRGIRGLVPPRVGMGRPVHWIVIQRERGGRPGWGWPTGAMGTGGSRARLAAAWELPLLAIGNDTICAPYYQFGREVIPAVPVLGAEGREVSCWRQGRCWVPGTPL